jgi:putative tryptophan/tyrosine transport system substrate-binding protein
MNRKITVLTLCAMLLVLCLPAEVQQPKKVPRIGYLIATSRPTNPARIEAFRLGLRELGYVEGKNIVIEWRYAEGKLDRLPALASELVRLKVDVIVTSGQRPTRAAKEATVTIPLSWRRIAILLEAGSSPALLDLAGTSRDCQPFTRRKAESDCSF